MEHLKEDLEMCTIEGNVVSLPEAPLKDYPNLRKALLNAGGKYKRNTFVFSRDPSGLIETLKGGTTVNIKKTFQAFYTPKEIAEYMMNQAAYTIDPYKVVRFLEPSAGPGVLVDEFHAYMSKRKGAYVINTCELQRENERILIEKGYARCLSDDFIDLRENLTFDLILANPPFTNYQELTHIKKMLKHLDKDGTLVTLCSSAVDYREDRQYTHFRNEIMTQATDVQDLPEGAFRSSGTNVRMKMLTFRG